MIRTVVITIAATIAAFVALWFLQPELVASMLTLGFVAQVLRISIPLGLAAMGGSITERAGVVDLALEAKLLFGAFAAAAFAHASGSAYVGVLGGMFAGALVAAAQLGLALRLGADQVIVGVGLNLLALGGTRFLLQLIYGEGTNSPPSPAFGDAVLANPIFWIAVIAAMVGPIAVARTRWGLRLRAAGDRPEALLAVGVSPIGARVWAGLVGGALAGAGGAQLSLAVGGFSADMSGGRGYIAIAMVILAGWRPAWAMGACALVAVSDAINIRLQVTNSVIPREIAPLLPYMLTLLVLVIVRKRRAPPSSLGRI
ncbi:MAG: ABC transporter permease [Kofleriaceae bacterium]